MKLKPHEQTGTEADAKAAWGEYWRHNELPDDVPLNPDEIYADKWKGWVDFLGWTHPQSN